MFVLWTAAAMAVERVVWTPRVLMQGVGQACAVN